MAKKIVVGLLFGGRSAEHDVSLVSAAAVASNLDRKKYAVVSIYVTRNGGWTIVESPEAATRKPGRGEGLSFLPWAGGPRPKVPEIDIYFPVLHGPFGEDGTIQGLFEMAGAPYVGAGVPASAAGMDKAVSKTLFRARGLPVVRHLVFIENEWTDDRPGVLRKIRETFDPPLFVKPANMGSSVGITKVKRLDRTARAIEIAFRYDRKILVEEGIAGREIECSVLGHREIRASLPGEVIPHREFYDYRDKYIDGKTRFAVPADLTPAVSRRIRTLAVEAFRAVDGSGMARVDFFLETATGKIFVNELNTIPGFTAISMYPKLWEASGIPFPQLLDALIRMGFERHRDRKSCLERTGA